MTRKFFAALLCLACSAGLSGCRVGDVRTPSVSLTFDAAALARAANRDDGHDTKTVYRLVVTLQGDYDASKTVRFTNKRDYLTVTFSGVPNGAKIYTTAEVYVGEMRVCSGTSGYSVVAAGNNVLSLAMQSLENTASGMVAAHDDGGINVSASAAMGDDNVADANGGQETATTAVISGAEPTVSSESADVAVAAPVTYLVAFNANGGSRVTSQRVTAGTVATAPPAPARVGYRFVGWYSDRALRRPFDFSSAIGGNVTLYAKWAASMGESAESDGRSAARARNSNADTDTTIAEKHDSTAASASGNQTMARIREDSGVVSDSTFSGDDAARIGHNEDMPRTRDKRGTDNGNRTDVIVTAAHNDDDDTTQLSAATVPVSPTAVYVVEFDTDGGSDVPMQALVAGDVASEPPTPARGGYRFVGWYADSTYTRPYDFAAPVTSRVTLYAKWEPAEDNRLAITGAGGLYLNGGSLMLSAALLSGAALPKDVTVSWRAELRRGGADVNASGERRYLFDAEDATCRIVRPLLAGGAYELYAEATYNGVTSHAVLPVTVEPRLRFAVAQVDSGDMADVLGVLSTDVAVTVAGAASTGLCQMLAAALRLTNRAVGLDLSQVTGLTALEEGAFFGCTTLSSISLPPSLTTVASRAFAGCAALSSVSFAISDGWFFAASDTAPTLVSVVDAAANARRFARSAASDGWADGSLIRRALH